MGTGNIGSFTVPIGSFVGRRDWLREEYSCFKKHLFTDYTQNWDELALTPVTGEGNNIHYFNGTISEDMLMDHLYSRVGLYYKEQ